MSVDQGEEMQEQLLQKVNSPRNDNDAQKAVSAVGRWPYFSVILAHKAINLGVRRAALAVVVGWSSLAAKFPVVCSCPANSAPIQVFRIPTKISFQTTTTMTSFFSGGPPTGSANGINPERIEVATAE